MLNLPSLEKSQTETGGLKKTNWIKTAFDGHRAHSNRNIIVLDGKQRHRFLSEETLALGGKCRKKLKTKRHKFHQFKLSRVSQASRIKIAPKLFHLWVEDRFHLSEDKQDGSELTGIEGVAGSSGRSLGKWFPTGHVQSVGLRLRLHSFRGEEGNEHSVFLSLEKQPKEVASYPIYLF